MTWLNADLHSPEDGQTVLAYWPGTPVYQLKASLESLTYHAADAPDSGEAWIDVHGERADAPSHWMALPEAPK